MYYILLLLAFAAAIVIEYFLSRRKSPILGLILPGAIFIATVIAVLVAKPDETVNLFQRIVQMVYALFYFNIPTMVLIIIYFRIRKKS